MKAQLEQKIAEAWDRLEKILNQLNDYDLQQVKEDLKERLEHYVN